MSSEWESYQLVDLAKFKYGKFLAKTDLQNSGFPVFSGYGVVGYLPTYQFSNPQLLIVCRGEGGTGDVKMSPPNCSITNLSIVISPNDEIISQKFLYWALKASDTHRLRTGSAQAQIVIGMLEKLKLNVPTIRKEQDYISGILDSLDDRIALLRKTNTTLEAIAQALFKSWFVDFDPVRAKQEGREPEGMDADTAALFPDSFEESELGLIPKGWRVGILAHLAKLNPESWTAKTHPETVRYIDLANAKNNEIDAIIEYTFDDAPSRARRALRAGDSIIGTVRPGNRSFAYIYQAPSNLTGSTGFAVLRSINAQNSEFLFIAATQDSSIDHLAHVADGGAYPAVRPEVVANIRSILPTVDVMNAFHNVVAPLFERVGENREQAQTIATLRDTLLPRLISGQLRLPDAEALVGVV